MMGSIDESGRALLDVQISRKLNSEGIAVTTWIDTAFDGQLVLPLQLIKELELDSLAQTEAILADGSKVTLEVFFCYIDWFGERRPIQIIANDGRYPLLGTELLENRILHIDYRMRTLSLD
ncbi:MAG: clan AA aspartic protease [Planctomycetaceae bacterium]|jgi:clan AA aspartic protease